MSLWKKKPAVFYDIEKARIYLRLYYCFFKLYSKIKLDLFKHAGFYELGILRAKLLYCSVDTIFV